MKHIRGIQKAITEYNRIFRRGTGSTAHFYQSDIDQIREISGGDLNSAIETALKAGYAIGYKRGKRVMQAGKD